MMEFTDIGTLRAEHRHSADASGVPAEATVTAGARTGWREWTTLWGYAFVAYTGMVVITATSGALNGRASGLHVDWASLILRHALQEYTCALFVPPLFWLVRRYPLDRRHWRRSLPILVAATLLFIVVKYVALYLPLTRIVFPRETLTLSSVLMLDAPQVLVDFLAVIGVAHALEFHRRAQDRERLATQLSAKLSEAQLQTLRSQLHPHFLFNTLNGVAALMHRDVMAADRMVTDLAELLRATLQHTGQHEIPLREELALLERYLAIVALRFGDRLTVKYEIAPDVGAALVPQFLLQPLGENAIEHGIARRPGPGVIVVGASRIDGQLRLTVSDDGAGLRDAGAAGHGIGLTNTRARLRGLYGTAQELRLDAASPDGGVCVSVILPYRVSAPAVRRATAASPA